MLNQHQAPLRGLGEAKEKDHQATPAYATGKEVSGKNINRVRTRGCSISPIIGGNPSNIREYGFHYSQNGDIDGTTLNLRRGRVLGHQQQQTKPPAWVTLWLDSISTPSSMVKSWGTWQLPLEGYHQELLLPLSFSDIYFEKHGYKHWSPCII